MERAGKSDGLVHGAGRSEELFAQRGTPGAGTIGETFQRPAIMGFESVVSPAECADIFN